MKQEIKYVSFDGSVFATESECLAYENANKHSLLIGLTFEQIERAIAGDQDDVAEALETIGTAIARSRRARGDLKRKRSSKEKPAHPMVEALQPTDGAMFEAEAGE